MPADPLLAAGGAPPPLCHHVLPKSSPLCWSTQPPLDHPFNLTFPSSDKPLPRARTDNNQASALHPPVSVSHPFMTCTRRSLAIANADIYQTSVIFWFQQNRSPLPDLHNLLLPPTVAFAPVSPTSGGRTSGPYRMPQGRSVVSRLTLKAALSWNWTKCVSNPAHQIFPMSVPNRLDTFRPPTVPLICLRSESLPACSKPSGEGEL